MQPNIIVIILLHQPGLRARITEISSTMKGAWPSSAGRSHFQCPPRHTRGPGLRHPTSTVASSPLAQKSQQGNLINAILLLLVFGSLSQAVRLQTTAWSGRSKCLSFWGLLPQLGHCPLPLHLLSRPIWSSSFAVSPRISQAWFTEVS